MSKASMERKMTVGIHKDDLFVKQTQSTLRKKAEIKCEGPLWAGRLVLSLAMVALEGAMSFWEVKPRKWT